MSQPILANDTITALPGLRVGHYTDRVAVTGCTVLLVPPAGVVAGVDVRGPAPATRETDLLRPGHLVERVHAILLTGGSAFGLDAAAGVMRFLEEQGIGFDTRVAHVPIVPAAALFDLAIGDASVRPGPAQAYQACQAASSAPVAEGSVGAGTGATAAKALGPAGTIKSGIGSSLVELGDGLRVGALVAVNPFGDVLDPPIDSPPDRRPAETRRPGGDWLAGSGALANTTIGIVAVEGRLTKEQANVVAMQAHDGIARAISPAHTLFDGDALFCLSVGEGEPDLLAVGEAASRAVTRAILRAIRAAVSLGGVPARSQ